MNPTMLHRGPDDEGYLSNRRLALGMRRLSIIDLAGGHQPIFNADRTVGAVLNGEIYNFQELRKQLEDRGHAFHTRSDSEVVAHAYEEWGADCVEHLQGMFALAIYDRRARQSLEKAGEGARAPSDEGGTLFLARDRLGIKPLYYSAISSQQSAVSQTFVFASEVRTLLASGVIPRQLSRAALESYLLFGSVSEPMTLVEGILSLPPGHRMTIRMSSSATAPAPVLKPESYWNVATQIANNTGVSRNGNATKGDTRASATLVRSLLEESVRKHLIADVPVGVFLSSGIDSTALAALASREISGVHTFTVAFPEKEFSEAAIARRTAEKFGTMHREVMLSGDEMLARLGEAVGALDQPTMDGINTYFVSWSARRAGLKVALSGLGGDEVFGGYHTFSRTAKFQQMARVGNRVPAGVRSAMAAALGQAGGTFIPGDAARKLAALWSGRQSLPDAFYFGRALFTPAQVSGLMNGAKPVKEGRLWWEWLSASAEQSRELDPFAAVSCMEMQSYLVSTLLRDTDSMSMAHSLEVRVPFLDHPLVEFVTSLPREVKLRKGVPKALLVAALGDLLPLEVVNQTKRGFTFPWAQWLRGPLKDRIETGLAELSPALQEALNAENARSVWRNYLDGKTSWSRPWSLYVLNEWVKKHLA
jgi:asparagine synthase (glutamine-hydrolysing)